MREGNHTLHSSVMGGNIIGGETGTEAAPSSASAARCR